MSTKAQIITMLRDEFNRWEELLAESSEAQITADNRIENLSIKDIVAHLTAWQQISVARLEAAWHHREPEFPNWPPELDPVTETNADQINAWIYETYQERPWSDVYQEWRDRFLHFLALAEAIPEADLIEVGKYAWLKEYPLAAVLAGSYEHLEPLLGLLDQDGKL